MKKHFITIAGKLGSGKSSTANRIAEKLGYTRASTGDSMRAIAKEKGISLEELSAIAENDPSIDIELDNYNKIVGEREDVVLDSRLGFHFIPNAFKVYLEVEPHEGARRILKDKESNPNRSAEATGEFDSIESIVQATEKRLASERKRYRELYGIENHTDESNFDCVIDTTTIPKDKVVDEIIEAYTQWLTV